VSVTTVIAVIGAKALYLTYVWLASAAIASYISGRKGYGEKIGLAFGLLLTFAGVIIWLIWPARADSAWKIQGPLGRGEKTLAQARAEREARGEARES
jgi:hypothetical protein